MPAPDLQIDLIDRPRRPLRPWMPPSWRAAVAGREVAVRIPEPVRRRCHKPKFTWPSEWSVRHRRMPAADSHPGAYRPEFARFAAKVMDTWAQPWVREVWFCGVDQAGKTNTMLSCIGWSARHAPGNIFYQMPDEASSDKIMGKKLIPMFQGTPQLAAYLSPRADDTTLGGVTLTTGVAIIPSWAGSLTSTATFSALYTFTDELDKAKTVGKEADPVDRIRKRTRNKRFGKNFFSSTPAGAWIYSGTMACVQVWAAAGRCPKCGKLVVMDEEHVVIPEGATIESIKADPGSIRYRCNACGDLWDEAARAIAYDTGDWVCIKGADVARPVDVGFLESAFPLPDVTLAHIAQVILRARAGDLSARRDLAHGIKAIDYREEVSDRKEDTILRYRSARPRNAVPTGTAMVVLLADTQQDHFYYEAWAVGYAPNFDLHMIRHGTVQSFADLDYLLEDETFLDADGREYKVQIGMIDSGGTRRGWQKHSRTLEVYEWCKGQPKMLPIKGIWSRRDGSMIAYKHVDTYPGTNRKIPGGLIRVDIKVDYFKDELARRLAIEPDDPGAISFHQEVDEGFARHYCAEGKDPESGEWVHDRKKGRNDFWDCTVYLMALLEILKTRIPRGDVAQAPPKPADEKPPQEKKSKSGRFW